MTLKALLFFVAVTFSSFCIGAVIPKALLKNTDWRGQDLRLLFLDQSELTICIENKMVLVSFHSLQNHKIDGQRMPQSAFYRQQSGKVIPDYLASHKIPSGELLEGPFRIVHISLSKIQMIESKDVRMNWSNVTAGSGDIIMVFPSRM